MSKMQRLFEQHMGYLSRGDIEGMVRDTFTEDIVMYHNMPFFEGKPPYTLHGRKEVTASQKVIFDPKNQGIVTASDPFNVVEDGDFLGFQAIVTSQNTGKWLMSDVWQLRGDTIAVYWVMAYLLEPPKKN